MPLRSGTTVAVVGVVAYFAIVVAFVIWSVTSALTMPANSDWVAFAVGSHLLKSGACLYCFGSQIAVTHAMGLNPGDGVNPFVSLPPVALIFEPLGLLAPMHGIAITVAVCIALFTAAVALTWYLLPVAWSAPLRVAGALVSAGSVVGLIGFLQWQWVMLLALLMTFALRRSNRCIAAGLVLSMVLIDPQVTWLALPMLLAARQWRMLIGFAVGAAGWLAASLLLVGEAALARWPGFLLDAHVNDAYRGVGLPAFAASITGSGSAAFWISALLGLFACMLAYGLRHRLRAYPAHALALGVILSVVAAPHIYAQDLSVLALPVIIVASRRGNVAMLIMLALSAIAAVGFLEMQQVLVLLPEVVLLMAALVLDDLSTLRDGEMSSSSDSVTKFSGEPLEDDVGSLHPVGGTARA